jgi:Calcineurin-like phosphoesterase
MPRRSKPKPANTPVQQPQSSPARSPGNTGPIPTKTFRFAEPPPTPDPTKFTVKHGSDAKAYKILDSLKGTLRPRPFPIVSGTDEPILKLEEAYGTRKGAEIVRQIEGTGQIVFHCVGDTGNVKGPKDEDLVADKMVSDFNEVQTTAIPSFFYHLGDVVYSFGETTYYYDQFYDPYRNYPAPIFAIPGNHDGMVAPNSSAESLAAFIENFCAAGQPPHKTPESGQLVRTAQIQPGVYFTLEAPFVRILGLYSNCLEDPGVISDQSGTYPSLDGAGSVQLKFLEASLQRIKKEKFTGAVLIAVHHPPYVAVIPSSGITTGNHGSSPEMLKDIDSICAKTGVWPHAVLSGHAHNYQRFTRHRDNRETPYLVTGNGGHAIRPLTHHGNPALRTPMIFPSLSNGKDQVVFENYDDTKYGYLRVIVDSKQLRIEYHPAPDGAAAKTPDDFVTVDLATRKLVHYQPLG